ncbi:adenine nucleotide alpha hydrolase [Scheffersomyces coipomensis]|uniref:adenine nucleotide alpha hydrolase n=1 Tax=Scheffersomyces coipomensis TaxID=1788519 RepID=UPI00315D5408
MKFVALISGGKDSFFNIHHCLSQGHELIALANLYPQDPNKDEIDSFMFQTVGHDIIDNYSQLLNVPLYRQAITGGSSNQHLEYSITKDDEIEDLYQLLSKVKSNHPDVEGVSCGAILSHYQRSRVENVCDRLSLTSLAYLWQRDQYELMQEMCQNLLDARLIKVAAIGLNENHLGKSISQLFAQLVKLNQLYEVHICGEGGEFETLVFDSPIFKDKKLAVIDKQIINHSNDDVSYLKVKVEVIDKDFPSEYSNITPPDLLTKEFDEILDEVKASPDIKSLSINDTPEKSTVENVYSKESIFSTKTKLYISNLISLETDIKDQAVEIFQKLTEILIHNDLTFNDIQHITLLLSDMTNFTDINSIYGQNFQDLYLPPSRICVETNLKTDIQLSCIVLKHHGNNLKSGHHIRSRSYWAPQNIGPYSQTIIETRESYKLASLSGQIPLIPSTMVLSTEKIEFDSVFSLQHLYRVKTLANVNKLGSIICFITSDKYLSVVSNTWKEYYSGIEDGKTGLGQLVIVQVSALPKNARVEWGGISYESVSSMYDDDDDDEEEKKNEDKLNSLIEKFEVNSHVDVNKDGSMKIVTLFTNESQLVQEALDYNDDKNYIQVVASHSLITKLTSGSGFEFLPVENVWDYKGNHYNYSIIWKLEN